MNSRIDKFHRLLLYAAAAVVAILCSCSSNRIDDLDLIKKYQPSNKYFKSTMVTLHFLIETSPTTKLDTIFRQVSDLYSLPVSAEGIPDGRYRGTSPADAFDYVHTVDIKVVDGMITTVDYDEIKATGKGKKTDREYAEEMLVAGTTPAIAYPAMENQLLNKQDLSELDAISGATYSLYRFRYAVSIALIKAKLAGEE